MTAPNPFSPRESGGYPVTLNDIRQDLPLGDDRVVEPDDPETEALIRDAARGDELARQRLLDRHRQRLRQMVALRLDRRLAPRLDPSDVVQEALADAVGKLDGYLRD